MKGSAKANRADCRLWRPTTLADDWASERCEQGTGRDRCHGRKAAYSTEHEKATQMSGNQELTRARQGSKGLRSLTTKKRRRRALRSIVHQQLRLLAGVSQATSAREFPEFQKRQGSNGNRAPYRYYMDHEISAPFKGSMHQLFSKPLLERLQLTSLHQTRHLKGRISKTFIPTMSGAETMAG